MKINKFGIYQLVVVLAGILIALLLTSTTFADYLNLQVYDYLHSLQNFSPDKKSNIVVIGIDNQSLEKFEEPLFLWQKYFAQVIKNTADADAKSLGIDLIFPNSLDKLFPDYDRNLLKAIRYATKKNVPVYMGFKAGETGMMPHKKFMFFASDLAYLNLYPDQDEKVRKHKLFFQTDHQKVYALPTLLAGKTDIQEPDIYLNYRQPLPSVLSFADIYFNKEPDKLKRLLKNKIVIIGVTSPKLPDIHPLPVKPPSYEQESIAGVMLHALITDTLLGEKQLKNVSRQTLIIISLLLGLVVSLLFVFLSPLQAILFFIPFFCLSLFAAFQAFIHYWYFNGAFLLSSLIVPALFSGTFIYISRYKQFSNLKYFFKSYVNQHVMNEIIADPQMVSFDGQKVYATIMFTDIRNFTKLSENMDPHDIVKGLNKYFEAMTRVVVSNNGYLNRYLGDGILAVFGAPNQLEKNGALAAVKAGIQMLEEVDALNKTQLFPNIEKIKIGIGIHTGHFVVGNIGCYEKMDYTVIGDAVNLSARIEGLTKEYQNDLLISEDTYELVKDRFTCKFIASSKVKGREQEVKLYKVIKEL